MVHIPRDKFNTNVRHTIQEILSKEVQGTHIEFQVKIEDANLTRLYVTVYSEMQVGLNVTDIEEKITQELRSWQDELEDVLVEKQGISESRLIFVYGENGDANTVDLQGTTEDGPNTVPAPHPNLRAK